MTDSSQDPAGPDQNSGTASLGRICDIHTDLAADDIQIIREIAGNLDAVADLMGADIFIDCPTRDRDTAIVVAHARPSNGKTLYKGAVVGKFAHRSNEPAALRTLDLGLSTMDLMARTQEDRDVRQNVTPIKNSQGRVIACLIAETDVTADLKTRRKVSMLSRTTEQLTRDLISTRKKGQAIPDHLTDGILIFNPQGEAVFANPVARKLYRKLGYMNALEGLSFSNLCLEDLEFADILEKKEITSQGVKFGSRVLNIKYALMNGRDKETAAGAVMLINDETDVKAAEKELILKSVAIKEIHHRVKNNLQTIASLLRLQSRRIDNDSAKKAFSESISRVLSIAATHEILAQNGVDDVDLTVMLKRIMHLVMGQEPEKGIRISIEGDSIKINSDVATSIALVVNELIQNCVKYAFVGRDSGHIRVEIHRGETYSNISIIDDGVGFDPDRAAQAGSLGRRIVQQLISDKLGGSLSVESGPKGTKVWFDFCHDPGQAVTA